MSSDEDIPYEISAQTQRMQRKYIRRGKQCTLSPNLGIELLHPYCLQPLLSGRSKRLSMSLNQAHKPNLNTRGNTQIFCISTNRDTMHRTRSWHLEDRCIQLLNASTPSALEDGVDIGASNDRRCVKSSLFPPRVPIGKETCTP